MCPPAVRPRAVDTRSNSMQVVPLRKVASTLQGTAGLLSNTGAGEYERRNRKNAMSLRALPQALVQGSLDGLCGLYAVVNAVRSISAKRLTGLQEAELFRVLVARLSLEGLLEAAICDGIAVPLMGQLIDSASSFLLHTEDRRLSKKLATCETPQSLGAFWDVLSSHIEEFGPGSVVLALGGRYDHWTCVATMRQRTIGLIDGKGFLRLNRKDCTLSAMETDRPYRLLPSNTYLLCAGG